MNVDSPTLTATERVIRELRERILDGKYGPGTHLHEAAMAAELKVSRTPVRDAMRVLANEELLVYSPNRGYVVRSVGMKDVLDAYDVRGTLEGLGCRIVAERGLDQATDTKLKTLLERGDKIFRAAKWGIEQQRSWQSLNTEFHFTLIDASRNRHLEPIMRQVRFFPRMFDSRLDPNSDFFQKVHTRTERLRSHHDHVHIVDAIRRREGARAESLMREHVYTNRELLRSGMSALESHDGLASGKSR
jgi:GntR family transcriptional regulator of vanillate catabolism